MRRILRLVVAFVVGFAVGSLVNMGLILIGNSLIPPPAGVDTATVEGLRASLHLFEPRHFLFPFLAHGLGTLCGAAVAAWLTPGRTPGPAYTVGAAFLLGGLTNVLLLPAPAWFIALDLVLAYLPAAWLGHRMVLRWVPGIATDGAGPEPNTVTAGSETRPARD